MVSANRRTGIAGGHLGSNTAATIGYVAPWRSSFQMDVAERLALRFNSESMARPLGGYNAPAFTITGVAMIRLLPLYCPKSVTHQIRRHRQPQSK